ncbi:MAG: pyridoxal phosphate-dependent aminotransferase [Clostridia bacterium]|nr:pyridoxal phosphate-dependent aminotransferase [Clostridia bacterium]
MSYNQKSYALGSVRSIIRETFEYGKIRASQIGADKVFDFSLGNPSVKPPKEVRQSIIKMLETYDETALHGYTSAQGDVGVRQVIADDIKSRFGVDMDKDFIYMTCGAAASLSICLNAVLNQGEECIVFAPFFTEYRVFVENAGGKLIVSTPEDNTFQIDINNFESLITPNTKAIILNSPNNPSGVVYTEDKIKALCKILNDKQKEFGHPIYLISDEPYRELVYGNVFVPYLMNYYDNTLVCYSFSKSLSLPGERIGYIAVCPKMQDAKSVYLAVCGAGRALGYVCAPSLFQRVVADCIGAKTDIEAYKINRDLIYNSLSDLGYQCVEPNGAFYLFVKSLEDDANAFCKRARDYELLLVPCDGFGTKGYVRISYCVSKSTIENSIPAFKKLIESYK